MKKESKKGNKINLKILILVFVSLWVFFICSNFVSSSEGFWVYQEDANSTSCVGNWGNNSCYLTYDGNWSSGACVGNPPPDPYAEVYFNYIKPVGATENSLWKTGVGAAPNVNWSIPGSCWNRDILTFKVIHEYRDGFFLTYLGCLDEEDNFVQIQMHAYLQGLMGAGIFLEEAMFWNIEECPGGSVLCSNECVNLSSDSNNCGSCGNVCEESGTCCNGKCVNLLNDRFNCGSCGNRVWAGECCNGISTAILFDNNNCGSCENVCSSDKGCYYGECILEDCNGEWYNPVYDKCTVGCGVISCFFENCEFCGGEPKVISSFLFSSKDYLCCDDKWVSNGVPNCGSCGVTCSGKYQSCFGFFGPPSCVNWYPFLKYFFGIYKAYYPLVINLISPPDFFQSGSGLVDFSFNFSGGENYSSVSGFCDLLVDEVVVDSININDFSSTYTFEDVFVSSGEHSWFVGCNADFSVKRLRYNSSSKKFYSTEDYQSFSRQWIADIIGSSGFYFLDSYVRKLFLDVPIETRDSTISITFSEENFSSFPTVSFYVGSQYDISNCTLFLDGDLEYNTNNYISNETVNFIFLSSISGDHSVVVSCIDVYGNQGSSLEKEFEFGSVGNYIDGIPSNFDLVDFDSNSSLIGGPVFPGVYSVQLIVNDSLLPIVDFDLNLFSNLSFLNSVFNVSEKSLILDVSSVEDKVEVKSVYVPRESADNAVLFCPSIDSEYDLSPECNDSAIFFLELGDISVSEDENSFIVPTTLSGGFLSFEIQGDLSSKTTPLENQSRLENLGENAFAYYAQMYIEYNNGDSWEYVSTVLNDSQTENLRILEVGDVVGLDTLWNPTGWNTSENVGDGTYRVVVDLVDNEGNLLYDEEKSSFLTTSFEFYLDSSSPVLIVSNYTGYTNQSVSLQFSASDENGIDFWWIDDEINFEINNSGFVTNLTELSSGVYPLGVFVNDSYGNLANGEVLITILDSCTESLVNTSESAWTNLMCVLDQMNQSQFWVEYDENNCGNFTNVTHYAYQLVGPIYQNTSWSEYLDLECLPTDYYNQTRNLTQFDIYGCATNTTYFEFQDNVTSCDFCTPSLANTSWTEWENDGVCLVDNNQQQIRSLIEYDSNECNEIENKTYYEYKNITCDYCTPSLVNTSASDWINLTCSLNQMNQSQFFIEYDENNCNEIENTTHYNYQLIGPTYQNTSWSSWSTIECLPTDYLNQTRNLTQFDIYGCAENITYFEYQDNFSVCDYCTPELINATILDWYQSGVCLINDIQQEIREMKEYDLNNCGDFENRTFYEYRNVSCDHCTPVPTNSSPGDWSFGECAFTDLLTKERNFTQYDSNNCYFYTGLESDIFENSTYFELVEESCDYCSYSIVNTTWSSWSNLDCVNTTSRNQTRFLTEYDENYESCYDVTRIESDLWNSGNNNTYYDYRVIADPTCGPYCGDGTCNNGETCSTCSTDCGSCGGGGSSDPEEPEVPEEPEEPSCEDECSSGENYKTCFDSKTISEKICGNYDEDECSEWSSSTKTSCPSLTSCSSGQCLPINCDPFWTCSSWGECSSGNQTRICTNTVCDLPVKIEYQSCISCIENWKCEYTSCSVGDEYSSPYDCVDLNYCGTFEKMPTKKECSLREEDPLEENPENPSKEGDESQGGETGSETSCVPSFVCQGWGECDASYSLQNIVDGITSVTGVQRRECVDSNKCAPAKTESKSCELKIDVLAKKTSWCNESYTEIYDSFSNKLLTRIKETKNIFSISGVNIDFLEGDFSGYCGYCYDGVKNYDEEEVDCGGASCPACVENVVLFDWARITSILSWTFFLLLFLFVTLTNLSDLKHILFSVYYKGAYFEEMFQYKMNSIFSNKQSSPEIVKARLDKNLKGARLSDVKISHLRKDFLKKSLKRKK